MGHGRASSAGGLSHCRGGNSWGGLGSWWPRWAHSFQAELMASRLGLHHLGWAYNI